MSREGFSDFLYAYLPLIDEHNKQRQSLLNLEHSWPTRNCWFRLLVTLVGMCVVDLHRLWLNKRASMVDDGIEEDVEILEENYSKRKISYL